MYIEDLVEDTQSCVVKPQLLEYKEQYELRDGEYKIPSTSVHDGCAVCITIVAEHEDRFILNVELADCTTKGIQVDTAKLFKNTRRKVQHLSTIRLIFEGNFASVGQLGLESDPVSKAYFIDEQEGFFNAILYDGLNLSPTCEVYILASNLQQVCYVCYGIFNGTRRILKRNQH